jgi:predicted amidohydrolase YtcJ
LEGTFHALKMSISSARIAPFQHAIGTDSMNSKPIFTVIFNCFFLTPAFGQTNSLQDLAGNLLDQQGDATIYVAREFLTMNPQQPKAKAVAVRDRQFVAVGSLDEVQTVVGKEAKLDRTFEGKVVTAGFVEQHVHPVLAALTMATKVTSIEDWDAIDGFSSAVRDPENYQKRLVEALKMHRNGPDKDQPFVTWGYHHYMHGPLSRTLLNKLAPDFPVIVWHRSCHEFYFNDPALRLAGIDKPFFDSMPRSARDQANWEKGHYFEQGAMAILGKITPLMASREQFVKGLEFTEQYYHRNGITVCCEPGGFFSKPIQDLINSVYSDDATPFNHYFMADGKTFAAANLNNVDALLSESAQVLNWGRGRTAYLPKQVKLLTDGAIFSQLMMMKDGYTDGHHGAWIMDPPIFGFGFQSYWDAGYQIHVHNNGDAGLDVLVGELEKAMKRNPRQNHRTVLVHFGFARPEQTEKWIKLGGIISSNPYYVTALAGRYGKIGMTEEWAQNMVPHGDVLKHGGSLSFHSDMPMAPAKPLQLVWAGVNRLTYEGNVAGPSHKVPLDVALKAITIDAAYSIQLEREVGSIEVGKNANLTVLDESPFDVAPEKLREITVWGTMLEGRVQPVERLSVQETSRSNNKDPRTNGQAVFTKVGSEVADSGERKWMKPQHWNDEYWQSFRQPHGATNTRRSLMPGSASGPAIPCEPGCSCSLSRTLGDLMVAQWNAESGKH